MSVPSLVTPELVRPARRWSRVLTAVALIATVSTGIAALLTDQWVFLGGEAGR